MLRKVVRTVTLGTILTLATSVAFGQVAAPKVVPQPTFRAKSILGSTVHIQGNTGVGTVDDIVLDNEGVIDYLIVINDGKLFTVPWESAKFNFEKRIAEINITQDQFRQVPTYTTTTYPDFYLPEYRTQIRGYYGLTPAHERRFERRLKR